MIRLFRLNFYQSWPVSHHLTFDYDVFKENILYKWNDPLTAIPLTKLHKLKESRIELLQGL